jgi:hypothetical protein
MRTFKNSRFAVSVMVILFMFPFQIAASNQNQQIFFL